MANKKKTFKDAVQANPALSYFSIQEEPAHSVGASDQDDSERNERKSKRLNLLIKPSVYKSISKISAMKRSSVNDLINQVLADYVQAERETLAKYKEVFGEDV